MAVPLGGDHNRKMSGTGTPHPFPDCPDGPRVYTLPAGLPFARRFAAGLGRRLAGLPPAMTARTRILVSGREQVTLLQRILADRFATGFLPSVHSLRGVDADPALAHPTPDRPLPTAVSRRHRLLVLSRLVLAFLRQQGDPAGGGATVGLAAGLADLLDELQVEGVDAAALDRAVPPELASHWQSAARFLALIGDSWPAYLQAIGREDPTRCHVLAVDALLAAWRESPPADPVLVAGSTATDATTRRLAAAVARLPLGAVILPGLDQELDEAAWTAIADPAEAAPGHPQHAMLRLLGELGLDRRQVRPWVADPPPRAARTRLLGQALRPALVTEAWSREAAGLDTLAGDAMRAVELVEAAGPDEEAAAIALTLGEAAATEGLQAAFVTEDDELRRRVLARCQRWSLQPRDHRGLLLAGTPYGRFALQAARVALGPPDLPALFGLLKDPHVRAGDGRPAHRRRLSAVERQLRREAGQPPGMDGLRQTLRAGGGRRPEQVAELDTWLAALAALSAPLADLAGAAAVPFADLLAAHLRVLADLEAEPLPAADRSAVLAELAALRREAPALGDLPPDRYPELLARLLSQRRQGFLPGGGHARIRIESTLAARFDPPDLLVFGGLNEDSAPGGRGEDPWLNRTMRAGLGLPPSEHAIGTLAHDAAELMAAPRVVLTRAVRSGGEPRVPSRWLLRLVNLLQGTGPGGQAALAAMRDRGARRLHLLRRLERPDGPPRPARPPAPRPPLHARPRRFSATGIERLLKDPYSVYAERILALRPLEPLAAPPDARLRGTLVHRVLARYLQAPLTGTESAAALGDRLDAAMAAEMAALADSGWGERWPWLADQWQRGLAAAAGWLTRADAVRLALGWRPAALEAFGRLHIDAPLGPVEIVARADRIDVREDGEERVGWLFDYKTGAPPHPRRQIGDYRLAGVDETATGWAWQLAIAALIARAGGFDSVGRLRVDGAEYVGLRGADRDEAGRVDAFANHDGRPAPALAALERSLAELFGRYDLEETPYVSWALPAERPRGPMRAEDHLARYAEWSAAVGDGDDGG